MPELNAYKDSPSTGNYSVFAEDEYRATIKDYKKVNRVSQYNPNGDETVDFYLEPIAFADETELSDIDGNEVKPDSRVVFFFDPKHLGRVPVVSKNRKFLAAALNVSPEDDIYVEDFPDDLIGREVIVALAINKGRNKVTDVRPIRKRGRTRVAPKAETEETPMTATKAQTPSRTPKEAAIEVFGDDVVNADDEY